MNTRQKGNAFQDWIEKWFLEHFPGCSVHNQKTVSTLVKFLDKKTGQWKEVWVSKRNDLHGCIDLEVIFPNAKILYIQATLDTGTTKRLEELSKVPFALEYCNVQLWQKREDGKINIKKYTGSDLEDHGKIIRRKFYPAISLGISPESLLGELDENNPTRNVSTESK
jgi:hypothetical protein